MYYKKLVGQTIGDWTVLDYCKRTGKTKLLCRCKCGNFAEVDTYSLFHGGTRSCGKCNSFVNENGYMRCFMKNGASFIFDKEDFPLVKRYTWSLARGHVRTSLDGKTVFLHRLITGVERRIQIDHINRDKLDNRRCNLRIATHQQNQCNKGLMSNNTSGYKGVCFSKRDGKYIAYINKNGMRTYLGYFDSAENAAHAYNQFAEKLHGEFAYLNPIRNETF